MQTLCILNVRTKKKLREEERDDMVKKDLLEISRQRGDRRIGHRGLRLEIKAVLI